MKPRYHYGRIEDYIIPYVIYLTLFVSAILFIFVSKSYAVSYIIGAITNIICFKLTIKTVDKIINNAYISASKNYVVNNLSKMGIYLIVLLIAGLSSKYHSNYEVHLEIIPVAIAFFSVKFMIYFKYFVIDKIFKVTNFDDSLKGPIFPLKEEKGEDDDY